MNYVGLYFGCRDVTPIRNGEANVAFSDLETHVHCESAVGFWSRAVS